MDEIIGSVVAPIILGLWFITEVAIPAYRGMTETLPPPKKEPRKYAGKKYGENKA